MAIHLKLGHYRRLLKQVDDGDISESRMIEAMEDIVLQGVGIRKPTTQQSIVALEKAIVEQLKMEHLKTNHLIFISSSVTKS